MVSFQTVTRLQSRTWYDFTLVNLQYVPFGSGIYWLGRNNVTIYIGSSDNLYRRLHEHYHTNDSCIAQANQFAIEPCSDYLQRERLTLQAFRNQYGRLPQCNDRI